MNLARVVLVNCSAAIVANTAIFFIFGEVAALVAAFPVGFLIGVVGSLLFGDEPRRETRP